MPTVADSKDNLQVNVMMLGFHGSIGLELIAAARQGSSERGRCMHAGQKDWKVLAVRAVYAAATMIADAEYERRAMHAVDGGRYIRP